jgi:amidase
MTAGQKDPAFLGATEIAAAIRTGGLGSRAVLEHLVERMNRYNPTLNAIIVTDLDGARARADAADEAVRAGAKLGPLHGVPMTVKESFNVAGLPTTFGLPAHRDNIAARNALAIDRLIAAGAVIFGKTNVPPWLADSQSSNDVYGATGNPWNLALSPGGSSGGSAAALAAGLTGLELGSDIAGSIRNPAHYCGVFGHKPTYGICPATGHNLGERIADSDIAVIGPLARSADDLELALSVIAGPDATAGKAWSLQLPPARKTALKDFRVAVVTDDPMAEVDRAVQDRILALAGFLREQGAGVSLTARPAFSTRDLDAIYMSMVRAATSTRLNDEDFAAAAERARNTDFTQVNFANKTLRGNTMSHREWIILDEQRHRIRQAWNKLFADYDVLLCPIAVNEAFPRTNVEIRDRTFTVNGHSVPYSDQLFWSGYSGLAYLPSTVAPIGLSQGGLPVGVQIVGAQYEDLTCIHFARLVERHYYGFQPPPGYR